MDYTIKFKSNEDSLKFLDNILEKFLEEHDKRWLIDINTEDNTITLERESLYYLAIYTMNNGILSICNILSIEGLGLWGLDIGIEIIRFFKKCQKYDCSLLSSTFRKLIVKYDSISRYDCSFLKDLCIRSKYKSIFELFTHELIILESIEYSDILENYFYNYYGINDNIVARFNNLRPNIKNKYNEVSLPNVMLVDKFRVFLDILTEVEFTLYDQKGL